MTNERGQIELLELRESYLKYIDDLNLTSLIFYETWFSGLKQTDSIHLMSRLHCDHKRFNRNDDANNSPIDMLLIKAKKLYRGRILDYGCSLAVIHNIPQSFYPLSIGSCTMSDFKNSKPWHWSNMNKERSKEHIDWLDDMIFNLWENPYNIRAMTIYDMDYRKEWRYGNLVYEGNNFGDASDFYIIGSISN